MATKTDKTTITRLSRVDWDSVGRICERVVAEGLDPARLDGLVSIGVDEVSWKRCRRSWNFRSLDHRNSLGQWIFGGRVEAIAWAV